MSAGGGGARGGPGGDRAQVPGRPTCVTKVRVKNIKTGASFNSHKFLISQFITA